MLRKDQRDEEKLNNVNAEEVIKEENRGNNPNNENENENFSNRPRRKTVVKQYKNENENESDNENNNESESDYDNDSENENRSISRNVKRNDMNISTEQIKNEYKYKNTNKDKDEDKDKDKNNDENIINKNDNKEMTQKRNFRNRHIMKRHASQSTQHDMWAADSYVDHSLAPTSAKPLFNWEHILLAVQDYADSLLKLNSSNITVRTIQTVRTSQCVS